MISSEVQNSMNVARQWASIAVPFVAKKTWGSVSYYEIEYQQHKACDILDMTCGIDWLIERQGVVKGVAVRCQKQKDCAYTISKLGSPTFTIRQQRIGQNYQLDSEYAKTLLAVQRGAITAAYQVHAYMNANDDTADCVVAYGVADRVKLYTWLAENPGAIGMNKTQDPQRQQTQVFGFVRFCDIPKDILIKADW